MKRHVYVLVRFFLFCLCIAVSFYPVWADGNIFSSFLHFLWYSEQTKRYSLICRNVADRNKNWISFKSNEKISTFSFIWSVYFCVCRSTTAYLSIRILGVFDSISLHACVLFCFLISMRFFCSLLFFSIDYYRSTGNRSQRTIKTRRFSLFSINRKGISHWNIPKSSPVFAHI